MRNDRWAWAAVAIAVAVGMLLFFIDIAAAPADRGDHRLHQHHDAE